MPGEISRANKGPSNNSPYVPSWCYPNNAPKICSVCGHTENYHAEPRLGGKCLLCACTGLPQDCNTSLEEMYESKN
jgi:hypothetical protein